SQNKGVIYGSDQGCLWEGTNQLFDDVHGLRLTLELSGGEAVRLDEWLGRAAGQLLWRRLRKLAADACLLAPNRMASVCDETMH
ncbi:hypothetical protein, partial [Rhodanobacter sp. L36]|uniref:hypothetical protein n=1 Tax=Rhodanobacter sp. L36 TaxID=1747221 RepID=UPI001C209548